MGRVHTYRLNKKSETSAKNSNVLSPLRENPSTGFRTRPDTNRTLQSNKMTRG